MMLALNMMIELVNFLVIAKNKKLSTFTLIASPKKVKTLKATLFGNTPTPVT